MTREEIEAELKRQNDEHARANGQPTTDEIAAAVKRVKISRATKKSHDQEGGRYFGEWNVKVDGKMVGSLKKITLFSGYRTKIEMTFSSVDSRFSDFQTSFDRLSEIRERLAYRLAS